MMNRLDNILEPNFEERGLQRPTSVARHVMSTTPKKCFDQVMNELRCNKDSSKSSRAASSVNQSENEVNFIIFSHFWCIWSILWYTSDVYDSLGSRSIILTTNSATAKCLWSNHLNTRPRKSFCDPDLFAHSEWRHPSSAYQTGRLNRIIHSIRTWAAWNMEQIKV